MLNFYNKFIESLMYFDQQESERFPQRQSQEHSFTGNAFFLTEEQRSVINKRLPRGFMMIKPPELAKIPPFCSKFNGQVEYVPEKRNIKIASEQLNKQFLIQPVQSTLSSKNGIQMSSQAERASLRFSQLPEGKSKQAEKIKNIFQKFRKHIKYPSLVQHLQKIGFMQAFQDIEAENKKNIHTIDSFKDRVLVIFNKAKAVTYEEATLIMLSEMKDEFLFHVDQARKVEFENNLTSIHKNLEKVARELSDSSGNYYFKKRKKPEKTYDQKQILYISELVRKLPEAFLIGVWEIIEEKPFQESSQEILTFDMGLLKPKKIRQIQTYVKKKLSLLFKSRNCKREKIKRKIKDKKLCDKKEEQKLQSPKKDEKKDQEQKIDFQQIKMQENKNVKIEEDIQRNKKESEDQDQSQIIFEKKESSKLDLSSQRQEQQNLQIFDYESNNSPGASKSNMAPRDEQAPFTEFELEPFIPKLPEQASDEDLDGVEFDSSDSSMISDEDDSDF